MSSDLLLLQDLNMQKEEMLSLLIDWVNINSYTENIVGLADMTTALSSAFSLLDGKIEKIDLPSYTMLDAKGNLYQAKIGQALRISKHPNAPIQILLGGHMDTVYPMESPSQRAERIDQDVLKGPGAADMKGGLLILLKSLEILEKSSLAGTIGWEVLITPDEEIGSLGSEFLWIEAAKRNQIGLIFEPSFPDGSLVKERKGSLNYTIIARGKAAHAGRDFYEGRNAIVALSRFITGISALTNQYREITYNIGFVEGGGPVNIVPDFALCRLNIRVKHFKDFGLVKASVEEVVKGCSEPNGATLSLHAQSARTPKPFDQKAEHLFNLMKQSGALLGVDLKWQPTGGVCDGNILAAAGLPTIDSLGTIGGCIHTADEYILINSLVERTQLTANFLFGIAKGEIHLM